MSDGNVNCVLENLKYIICWMLGQFMQHAYTKQCLVARKCIVNDTTVTGTLSARKHTVVLRQHFVPFSLAVAYTSSPKIRTLCFGLISSVICILLCVWILFVLSSSALWSSAIIPARMSCGLVYKQRKAAALASASVGKPCNSLCSRRETQKT